VEGGHDPEAVDRQIASIPTWRHRIEVAPGVVTPGTEDTVAEATRLALPDRLDGKRVLDVGCSDGFYSFLCESRGAAAVLAIDDESSLLAGGGRNGFSVASSLLGSNVDYAARDSECLDPATDGHFDVLLLLNVLYHLPNPFLALQRLASVANPDALLVLKTHFRQDVRVWWRGRSYGFDVDRRPKWWFFPTTELGGDPTNWWSPNRAGLEAMLAATGWGRYRRIARHGDRLYYHARPT
jgi:tRNA (mo5U34)-methyltransferase